MKRTKSGGCDDSTWRKRMEFSEAFPTDLETVAQAEFPADGRRSSQSEANNNKQRCQVWGGTCAEWRCIVLDEGNDGRAVTAGKAKRKVASE